MGMKKSEVAGNETDLRAELRERVWPPEVQGVIIGEYDKSPYVREGRVFSRALRMHQSVSAPITPGESGVTALCRGSNSKIYGATSGKRSHMFFYDPSPMADGVVEIGVLEGVRAAQRTIAAGHDQRVFVGASEMLDEKAGGPIFVHFTQEDYHDEFRGLSGPVEKLVVPVKGECIAVLCSDPNRKSLYGVSSKTGTFFVCDYETKKVRLVGPVSKDRAFSRTLVLDSAGNVFGTHSLGTLFRYSPDTGHLEDLGTRIPGVAGREFYNQLDSAVYDPVSRLIYGAGTADGVLFSLDPVTLEVRSLGKVIAEPRVRAMVASQDGRIFGVAGCEDGMGHLFCYDRSHHELRDLGIMQTACEVWRRGFEFDAACAGENGELYFGENEWEGHLFLYFPRPAGTRRFDEIPF